MKQRHKKPISPGQILLNQFLKIWDISQSKLARDIDVPRSRIAEIIAGNRAITADTALRLGKYFDTSPQFWLNMQSAYDLEMAKNSTWPAVEHHIRMMDIETRI